MPIRRHFSEENCIVSKARFILLPLTALALASCGSDSEPTGQVAATVDGTEITVTEVANEMGGASSADPAQQQAMANVALNAIIARTIMAKEAEKRGLDKTPEGAILLEKARQLALVDLVQRDLAGTQPTISDQDALRFVSENRASFDGRTIAVVDQLAVPEVPAAVVEQMKPIQTLAGIRELLDANKVPYRRSLGTVDSLSLTGEMGRQIGNLAVGEVYVVPQGGGVRVNAVRSRETYPVTGDDAVRVAKEMLSRQRSAGQVSTAINQILDEGKKNVKYASNFGPPEAAGGNAPAPAAAATTAAR